MKLFGRPSPRSARWWAFDVFVFLLGLPVLTFTVFDAPAATVWFTIVAQVVRALPLLVRRIWPEQVFWWIWICTAVLVVVDVRLAGGAAAFIALYTVAAAGTARWRVTICAGALGVLEVVADIRISGSGWWSSGIFSAVLMLAAVGFGLYRATRRAYLSELVDRAARLELEKVQVHELAVINERARISREMHDIVAHHLTVIVALSDAASLAAVKDPDRAAGVMATVAATGRQALEETRRLLGVSGVSGVNGLGGNRDPEDRSPLPDLAGLVTLIDGVRAAGLPVRFQITGNAPHLPALLELTIYRLVQEALTNTMKHGGANVRAVVRLRYLPEVLQLDIQDDGAGVLAPGPTTSGRGLAGMRERAAIFGGTVEAGPDRGSGWRVSAQFRLDASEAVAST